MNESSSPGVTEEMVEAASAELLEALRKRAPWLGPMEGRGLTRAILQAARPHDPLLAEVEGLRRENERLVGALNAISEAACGCWQSDHDPQCARHAPRRHAAAALSPSDGTEQQPKESQC